MSPHPILDRRLLFVTGKGGVGKTATAATLALYAFRRRKRVLVVELSPYGRLREFLGGPEPGPEPREIQPSLELVRINPRRVLEDFLSGLLRFRTLTERLMRSNSFTLFTAAAPGIEEFLVLNQIAEYVQATSGLRRRQRWDLVIVDAPATGHSVPFLSTARTLRDMVPVGPIGQMAVEVDRLLGDADRTAAIVVTLAEEMAVNETIEMVDGLRRETTVTVGPVVVNAVWPERFTQEEAARISGHRDDDNPLVAAGRHHIDRRRRAVTQLARVREELDVDPVEFPFLMNSTIERPQLRPLVSVVSDRFPVENHAG